MQIFNKTYKNGLRLVHQKTDSNVTAVNILFNVGSRNESENEQGFSHFIEHLMFKSSERFTTEEIMDKLTFFGADFNAYTSKTTTRYIFKCLSENFENCFEIYSDMLLSPKLIPEEMDKERNVVVEEMKKCADDPVEVAYENVMNNYYSGSSYAHDELGKEDIIMNVSREQLLEYKNKHYTAENCIVSVVGNLDFDEVQRVVEKHFSSKLQGEKNPKLLENTELLPNITKHIDVVERPDNQANVCIKIKSERATSEKRYVADIYTTILGNSQNSRLYKTIREDLGLVYTIYAFNDSNYLSGSIVIFFGTRPKNIEKTVIKIKQIIKEMGSVGISEEELQRAKNWRKSVLEFHAETAGATAESNGTMINYYGNVVSKEERGKLIQSVTLDDVNEFAKQIASEANFSLTAVGKNIKADTIVF